VVARLGQTHGSPHGKKAFKNHDKGEGRGANTLTNKLLALVERSHVENF